MLDVDCGQLDQKQVENECFVAKLCILTSFSLFYVSSPVPPNGCKSASQTAPEFAQFFTACMVGEILYPTPLANAQTHTKRWQTIKTQHPKQTKVAKKKHRKKKKIPWRFRRFTFSRAFVCDDCWILRALWPFIPARAHLICIIT